MCTVSMVGDHYRDNWERRYPSIVPNVPSYLPSQVTREEFDNLKRQVGEMTELLKRAKKYDEDNGEPDCEMDEKMDLLRKVAKLCGVDLDEALK